MSCGGERDSMEKTFFETKNRTLLKFLKGKQTMMLSDHHIAALCNPDQKYANITTSIECNNYMLDTTIIKHDVFFCVAVHV